MLHLLSLFGKFTRMDFPLFVTNFALNIYLGSKTTDELGLFAICC